MDQKWIENNQKFPDSTNVYIDPRQVVIPPINGTTEYLDQTDYPDYLVVGGNSTTNYDIIDGGDSTTDYPLIGGQDSAYSG
jgi:hypothetical protein